MTGYATARPVIVRIVEGTTGLTKVQGLGSKLIHDATGNERVFNAFRHFHIEVRGGLGRRGPGQAVARFAVYNGVVVVDYPDSDDAAAIDAAIVADYEAVSLRLQSPTNWQPASTTAIRILGNDDGADFVFPFEVADVAGGKRLSIFFPFEVITA